MSSNTYGEKHHALNTVKTFPPATSVHRQGCDMIHSSAKAPVNKSDPRIAFGEDDEEALRTIVHSRVAAGQSKQPSANRNPCGNLGTLQSSIFGCGLFFRARQDWAIADCFNNCQRPSKIGHRRCCLTPPCQICLPLLLRWQTLEKNGTMHWATRRSNKHAPRPMSSAKSSVSGIRSATPYKSCIRTLGHYTLRYCLLGTIPVFYRVWKMIVVAIRALQVLH